jgi:3',5'-cyclic AMP phosphodiesterase CpdA
MFVFAHISDTHIGQDRGDGDGGARARERTERVLRTLDGLPGELDAVILTGDVTDHGTPAEYAQAAKLLDGSRHTPLHCPGNHDVRGPYRAALLGGDPADSSPVNRLHTLPGATFAMCDSTVPGRGDGLLDDATLAWLDDALAHSPRDRPAFVCCHHPPQPLHGQYVDPIRQFGEDRLAAVLGRHGHVAAVLCGHSHTPAVTVFAGLPLVAAPAVVSTLRMPWEGTAAGPVDYELPPTLAYHVYDDEGRLTTHFRVVP